MKSIIITFSIVFISNLNYCQSIGGYVEYHKVQKSFSYYLNNLEKIEIVKTKLNDSLNKIMKAPLEIKSLTCGASKEKIQQYSKYLTEQGEKFENFKNFALKEIKVKNEKLENLTEKKISFLMKEFCELKGISFLYKKTDLIYCKNCKDYTFEFIEYMEQRN